MVIHPPSILITDDDRAFRETLGEVFQPRGFRTLLAADGQEAIEIVRREQIHLLLLDMHMPRLTGLETLRQAKRLQAVLPCILISADMNEVLRQQAYDADAFSVLDKPVSFAEVTSTVRQALREAYDWPEM